jgi:hypothetical protein
MEKILRQFDLERPDAEPLQIPGMPSGVRTMAYLDEHTLLATCTDTPGIM